MKEFDLASELDMILSNKSKDPKVNDLELAADYLSDAAMMLEDANFTEESEKIMDILRAIGKSESEEDDLYVKDVNYDEDFEDESDE